MRTLFTVLVMAGMATAQETRVKVDVKTGTPAPAVRAAPTVKREVIEWVPVRRVVECPGCPVPVREEVTLVRKVIVIEEVAPPPPVIRYVARPVAAVPVYAAADAGEVQARYGPFGGVREYRASGAAALRGAPPPRRPSVFGMIFGY